MVDKSEYNYPKIKLYINYNGEEKASVGIEPKL